MFGRRRPDASHNIPPSGTSAEQEAGLEAELRGAKNAAKRLIGMIDQGGERRLGELGFAVESGRDKEGRVVVSLVQQAAHHRLTTSLIGQGDTISEVRTLRDEDHLSGIPRSYNHAMFRRMTTTMPLEAGIPVVVTTEEYMRKEGGVEEPISHHPEEDIKDPLGITQASELAASLNGIADQIASTQAAA